MFAQLIHNLGILEYFGVWEDLKVGQEHMDCYYKLVVIHNLDMIIKLEVFFHQLLQYTMKLQSRLCNP